MMKTSSIILIGSAFLVCSVFPQQTELLDKFLEMAQKGLLIHFTAEEIRAKIKEAGFTEEEAIRLAKERNIDLEKYLRAEAGAKASRQATRQAAAEIKPVSPRPPSSLDSLLVPEFSGRVWNLQPFGYALFQQAPTAFEPIVNVPTPANYMLGPGDEIVLNVWGETQLTYTLTVARDGYIVIQDVGKIQLAGVNIDRLRKILLERMTAVYASLANGSPRATSFLDVSIGKLRTIQVFVLGEARLPGVYSLSGLATALTGLYYAGGPNVNGTLREIKVLRDDKPVAVIDFYHFALSGKREQDIRVQEGDVLFIEKAGKRIAVEGGVRRPGIYELQPLETIRDLIRMAGGLRDDAYTKRIHIERIIPFEQRGQYQKDILDIDVSFSSVEEFLSNEQKLESGDVVTVFSITRERENLVEISGNVWKPGVYELTQGMTVRDLILKADSVQENTFMERGTIVRTRQADLKKEIVPFNLRRALDGDTEQNKFLQRLDSVTIYNEDMFYPEHPVTVNGAVRKPGVYARAENMTVADLIILAGGLQEGADVSNVEVARLDTTKRDKISEIHRVSLAKEFWKERNPHDFVLKDFDQVSVRSKPEYSLQKSVRVRGEALYPGVYALRYNGERISDLVKRFGGFKNTAYLPGVRLIRSPGMTGIPARSPLVAETAPLDSFGRPLDIPARLASSEVPLDIEELLDDESSEENLVLQPGDELVIPADPGVVYVQGQVYTPSSVPYKAGASLHYYVRQAGGFTRNADEDNVVVILPNGKKWEPSGFFLFSDREILSGSTVIAPLKLPEREETLSILKEWTSIGLSAVTMAFILWQVTK